LWIWFNLLLFGDSFFFVLNQLTPALESEYDGQNISPPMYRSCYRRQGKKSLSGLPTCVESVVYSRRTRCAKRKLEFDETGPSSPAKKITCVLEVDKVTTKSNV
jgi:hypothetical protein